VALAASKDAMRRLHGCAGALAAGQICAFTGGSLKLLQHNSATPADTGLGLPQHGRSSHQFSFARPRVARCCSGGDPATQRSQLVMHLTGFGPFGNVSENPTSIICRQLRDLVDYGRQPEGVNPTVLEEFSKAGVSLRGLDALEVSAEACNQAIPRIVTNLDAAVAAAGNSDGAASAAALIHLGVASGSKGIRLECRAANVADFRIPDARGRQSRGEAVVEGAEPVLYTTLQLPELLSELHDSGMMACEISTDAGRYLCNYVYFASLHACQSTRIPVLFVHVPSFEDMACPQQVTAVLLLVLAIARQLRGLPPSSPVKSMKPMG